MPGGRGRDHWVGPPGGGATQTPRESILDRRENPCKGPGEGGWRARRGGQVVRVGQKPGTGQRCARGLGRLCL